MAYMGYNFFCSYNKIFWKRAFDYNEPNEIKFSFYGIMIDPNLNYLISKKMKNLSSTFLTPNSVKVLHGKKKGKNPPPKRGNYNSCAFFWTIAAERRDIRYGDWGCHFYRGRLPRNSDPAKLPLQKGKGNGLSYTPLFGKVLLINGIALLSASFIVKTMKECLCVWIDITLGEMNIRQFAGDQANDWPSQ